MARRDTLSFGHHAEAAALPGPEQDFWLRKAADQDWSRNHLRREIPPSLKERQTSTALPRAGQPPASRQPAHTFPHPEPPRQRANPEPHDPSQHGILIMMTTGQIELCQHAAASCRLPSRHGQPAPSTKQPSTPFAMAKEMTACRTRAANCYRQLRRMSAKPD